MALKLQYDLNSEVNRGIDYSGIPDVMYGKPSKGTDTGKWDEVILDPTAVVNGALASARCVIVTTQGQATPADVLSMVRQTSNGNYIAKVKRDTVPDAVKAARALANAAQKADWKANGPRARQETAPTALPMVPGQAAPTAPVVASAPVVETAPTAPVTAPVVDDEYAAFLAWKAAQTAPTAPVMPTVPTAPVKPARGSKPSK